MQANTGGLRRFQNGGRKTDCTRLNWNLQNLLVVDIGTFLDITVYWQNKVKYSDLKRHQPSLYDKHSTYYNSENYVTFDFCSKTVLIYVSGLCHDSQQVDRSDGSQKQSEWSFR